jgi:small GTP-binding protein
MILKLCLLGDGGVGKTTFAERAVSGEFKSETEITIGVDFQLIPIKVNLGNDGESEIRVDVAIWDLGGESRFRIILPSYINGADGALLLYDVNRYKTAMNLPDWVKIWRENTPEGIPLYLIGSKVDQISDSNLDMLDMNRDELKEELGIDTHYYVSSKTGQMVNQVIRKIVDDMLDSSIDQISRKYGL